MSGLLLSLVAMLAGSLGLAMVVAFVAGWRHYAK